MRPVWSLVLNLRRKCSDTRYTRRIQMLNGSCYRQISEKISPSSLTTT
jgi:hypothetical protein